jgi:acyl-CoA synthetase (AMP-forming)/AMP-acid ligase II
MNVVELLAAQALAVPERTALIDRTGRRPRTLTFAELERATAHAAAAFRAAGLSAGDRVAVIHPMNAGLYVGLAGLLRAGCVAVVCDAGAQRADLERCCAIVEPRAVFGSAAGLCYAWTVPHLARLRRRFASDGFAGAVDIRGARETQPVAARAPGDAAIMSFTSGSTGVPKIVVRSHALLRAQFMATREVAPKGGIDFATMPLVLLANLAAGVTSVIPGVDLRRPGRADAERLADDIAATHATSITASPALLERLLRIDAADRLRTLTTIVSGGAPVMPALVQTLRWRFPGASVVAVYGSTEAEPIAAVRSGELDAADIAAMRSGSGLLAGTPVQAAAVRILRAPADLSALAQPVEANAVGEIVVAGPHVVPGYLAGRGDAETKLHSGDTVWHRTGDLGYVDERGRIWLVGRAGAADTNRLGAHEPLRVESALSFEPGIARAALARVGARRVLALELRPRVRIDPARVRAAVPWAAIDDVLIVRIPVDRRHNAKVDAPALARRLRAHAERA